MIELHAVSGKSKVVYLGGAAIFAFDKRRDSIPAVQQYEGQSIDTHRSVRWDR